jgi:hypothetical protein
MEQDFQPEVESATAINARKLLRAATLAGNCSHPIRLRGEAVNLATGEVVPSRLSVACKDRRAIICAACSDLYKADAWILVSAGLIGGKGVSAEVGLRPRLFVTLTAPSFGPVHRRTSLAKCHVHFVPRCSHGHSMTCRRTHDEDSRELGTPLCVNCFGYEGAVLWNAYSSKLWNRFVQELRRQLGQLQRDKEVTADTLTLSYLKVAEFQKRGLVHFHAIVRIDSPFDHHEEQIEWSEFEREQLMMMVRRVIRSVSWTSPFGIEVRWGSQFDVRDLTAASDERTKVASYVAKYATKTTNDSIALARRFTSRDSIKDSNIDPHLAHLAITAWDLGHRPELASLKLPAHAHSLGFTGQIITKSRHFSTTFRELREVRARYMAQHNLSDPIEGSYSYDGRGYDDPRAAQVAELMHSMIVEVRREMAARRRAEAVSESEVGS